MEQPQDRQERGTATTGVAREMRRGTESVAPSPLFPRWLRLTLTAITIVAALAVATQLTLYWTVGDDWGWRCGPDHPLYQPSEHFRPICEQPNRL